MLEQQEIAAERRKDSASYVLRKEITGRISRGRRMHATEAKGDINLLRMERPASKTEQAYKNNKSQLSQVIISKRKSMTKVGCAVGIPRPLRNVIDRVTLVVTPDAIIRRLPHE